MNTLIRLRYYLLFLFFLLSFITAKSQEKKGIKLSVKDCLSDENLAFANIYSLKFNEGTATNFQGVFSFNVNQNDTLIISYIGYKRAIIPVKELLDKTEICLSPQTINIREVNIEAENDLLYELVSSCRQNRQVDTKYAKSYFLLKSKVNNQQVELIEGYYNGKFKNYNIDNLELKIGRIFLSPYQDNFFVSLGTSYGINMHQTFFNNPEFPLSPLEFNKRLLKQKFLLTYHNKFSKNGNTVYVIDFKPKNKNIEAFSGKIWLDSTRSELLKIKFLSNGSRRSPFIPVGDTRKINAVSFDITKTYEDHNWIKTVRSIDFNYKLNYTRDDGKEIEAETEAVLFAYDYNSSFLLPTFPKDYKLNDYQNIVLAPYNQFFWNNHNEFQLEAEEEDKNLFVNNKTTNYIDSFSFNRITNEVSFNSTTYRKWSKKRVTLSSFDPSFSIRRIGNPSSVEFFSIYDKYNLDIKIYMDINWINDSIDVQLATIFDPFTSYIFLEKNRASLVFINLYFDLVEIYKRKLANEVRNLNSIEAIKKAYHQNAEALNKESNAFFQETLGGTRLEALAEWNHYVYNTLKIDNLDYFGLNFKTGEEIKED